MARVRPLPNPGRSPALKLLNLRDFSGGLVSRDYNEVDATPNMLREATNIVLQEGGSVGRRGGFTKQSTLTPTGSKWVGHIDPAGALVWVAYSGTTSYMGYSNGFSYTTLASFQQTYAADARHSAVYTAGPNAMASYKQSTGGYHTYIACGGSTGGNKQTYQAYNTGNTAMNGTSATWQDSYASPATNYFPKCAFVETHLEYMFCAIPYTDAGVLESNVRIRWSHPGSPTSWRSIDYIDLPNCNQITGMISIGDQLVILGTGAVYALNGYSADTFSIRQIHGTGPANPYWMTQSADGMACYWGDAQGVWRYDGRTKQMISKKIAPLLTTDYGTRSPFVHFLHYGRPFLAVPVLEGSSNYFYVLAEDVGGWVKWSWTPNAASYLFAWPQATLATLFCCDDGKVQSYDINATGDTVNASLTNIAAAFKTGWIDADQPAVKKSWKRPELMYRASGACSFTLTSYNDYSDAAAVRTITASQAGSGANYEVDRLQSLGPARAVSIRVAAPTAQNVTWSIEDLVLKFRPKPVRN